MAAAGGSAGRGAGASVVMGIPLEDSSVASLTRKVLGVSAVMSIFSVVTAIVNIALTGNSNVGFLSAVAIPFCAYNAVRRRHVQSLRLFNFCNACTAGFFIASLIITLSITVPSLDCACDPGCARESLPNLYNTTQLANTCANKGSLLKGYWLTIGFGVPMAVLQLVALHFGRRLARSPYFITTAAAGIPTAMPVGTYAIAVQPGGGGPAYYLNPQGFSDHGGHPAAAYAGYPGYSHPGAYPPGAFPPGAYPGYPMPHYPHGAPPHGMYPPRTPGGDPSWAADPSPPPSGGDPQAYSAAAAGYTFAVREGPGASGQGAGGGVPTKAP